MSGGAAAEFGDQPTTGCEVQRGGVTGGHDVDGSTCRPDPASSHLSALPPDCLRNRLAALGGMKAKFTIVPHNGAIFVTLAGSKGRAFYPGWYIPKS